MKGKPYQLTRGGFMTGDPFYSRHKKQKRRADRLQRIARRKNRGKA